MEFAIKTESAEKAKTPLLIVGVYENGKLTPAAEQVDSASQEFVAQILAKGDFEGKTGQSLMLYNVPSVQAERVLLVGLGKEKSLDEAGFKKAVASAANAGKNANCSEATCFIADASVKGRDLHWKIVIASQIFTESEYRSDKLKSKKEDKKPKALQKITWSMHDKGDAAIAKEAAAIGAAIGSGANLAKDLGNLPGNVCTPTYLAEQAKTIGNAHPKIKVQVLEQMDCERLGMGSFLSVSRGSRQPPKFIVMEYKGGKKDQKPVVLVGKGLTFDSGGISIKSAPAMDEMKFDMCGGASVLGTFNAVAEMGLAINLIGLVPCTENMPDGNANKPGDIVTSLSGQTIEILNTDAEGRLILCDALTYAERYEPEIVIDIATLTGACVIALGKHASGMFSNHNALARDLEKAGQDIHDRCWEMPLWEEYQEQLKSPFADMANVGGKEAGAITGACFLARFTKKFHWAHLDIAGTAWVSGGADKGATGRPVPLLTQYLINRVAKAG